ncbi:pentapeptide repeat-containing protein [Nonomuraea recticatena]|uniref:Pentapeptide repeat-containing protein n=1 Tax=Nonomuraea recticatena TaxID=46178 RepID=A0ABP6FZ70_9ACTN
MGELEKSGAGEPPGLRLMRIGPALTVTAAAAVVLLAGVIAGGLALLGVQGLKPEAQVSATTLFDLLKIAFAVVAGLGGLVALVVAYRRQKVAEAAQVLAEQSSQREATKLHNERFTTASGQLGHDSPAVRLAGAHALAGLADDAPTRELRQTCIDVLCAYLRMPYTPKPAKDAPEADRLAFAGLREVRHTIIRLITAHLRDNATVSWQGHDLDFTGVVFDGGDFSGAEFSGGMVTFRGAEFSSGGVAFSGAVFSGGIVDFGHAEFSGGVVTFSYAQFLNGGMVYLGAVFSSGSVAFSHAQFSGGEVSFIAAQFAGSAVGFNRAEFSGGTVAFSYARFSGGTVDFRDAQFSGGTVDFRDAQFFGGAVDFRCQYPGPLWEAPPMGIPDPVPPGVLEPAWWPHSGAVPGAVESKGTPDGPTAVKE